MRIRRIFAVIILVSMLFTCLNVEGAAPQIPGGLTDLSKSTTSSVTVEQAIVIIMTALGKAPGSKPIEMINGQKPSSWSSSYISEANSKQWLPIILPKLSSNATKGFVTGFFMSCAGYKVYQTNITPDEQLGLDASVLNVAFTSACIKVNTSNALQEEANKGDVSKLLTTFKKNALGWYARTAAWKLYSTNKLTSAAAVFKICAEAGPNAGATSADIADAHFGLGSIMAHYKYKNYFTASESFKMAIKLSPTSNAGKNAVLQLKNLPALELGLDFMPEKPLSYEELLSVYANSLDLKINSVPGDFKITDLSGSAPSDWAKKYVNFIYYSKYAPSIPKSFKDPVPRYWAASFAARIKYLDNYEYDKYYIFSDLGAISADDRMLINISLDRNLFPMPGGNTFNPDGKVLRKELKGLIESSKKPGEPHKLTYTKTNYEKIIDTYYIDNGLDHFAFQNSIINTRSSNFNMIDFGTVYFYSDDPHKNDFNTTKYKSEGTKYIRTRFQLNDVIGEGITAARNKNIKTMVEFDAKDNRSYTLIKDPAQRQDIVNDLVHITELYNMNGVHIAFEHIPKEARDAFSSFIKSLSKELKAKGKLLSCVVGAYSSDRLEQNSAYDLDVIGKECDYVKVVLYDDFPSASYSSRGTDGPISRLDWNEKMLKYMVQKVPARKILLGMGAYGIDFNITNKKDAKLISLTEVKTYTDKAKPGSLKNLYNEQYQSPYYEYTDSYGNSHRLWYENKKSLSLRMDQVHKYNLGGIFYFWIGSDSQELFDAISEDLR